MNGCERSNTEKGRKEEKKGRVCRLTTMDRSDMRHMNRKERRVFQNKYVVVLIPFDYKQP